VRELDFADVTEVYLPGGWHPIEPGSLTVEVIRVDDKPRRCFIFKDVDGAERIAPYSSVWGWRADRPLDLWVNPVVSHGYPGAEGSAACAVSRRADMPAPYYTQIGRFQVELVSMPGSTTLPVPRVNTVSVSSITSDPRPGRGGQLSAAGIGALLGVSEDHRPFTARPARPPR
jgi:hypothetical protein